MIEMPSREEPIPCYDPQELAWYSSDNERQMRQNLKQKRGPLARWGWLQPNGEPVPIDYSINGYRFRDEPIDDRADTAIALGCSCTFGVGMHRKDIWPSLVERKINKKIWNLGWPAGGLESCYRALELVLPMTKSKSVFLQAPSYWRRELLKDGGDPILNVGGWNLTQPDMNMFLADREYAISRRRTMYAIIQLCERYGADLFVWDAHHAGHEIQKYMVFDDQDKARDLLHPGNIWHNHAMEKMLAERNKGYTDLEHIYKILDYYESYKEGINYANG